MCLIIRAMITSLVLKDIPQIHRIIRSTGVFTDDEFAVAMELIDHYLTEEDGGGYRMYCYRLEGNVVAGYVCFGPIPMTQSCFDFYWIAVDPSMGRRHVGSQLMAFMESEIAREGGQKIFIDTSSTAPYEAARSLYLKRGYRVAAKFDDFYRPGDHKLVFVKNIIPHTR